MRDVMNKRLYLPLLLGGAALAFHSLSLSLFVPKGKKGEAKTVQELMREEEERHKNKDKKD